MRIGNLVRIAPSGHKRALHSLILQYLRVCYDLPHLIPDKDIIPYMDLSNKITGFHTLEDTRYVTNPWNRYFIQPELETNSAFRMELVGATYDYSLLIYDIDKVILHRYKEIVQKYIKFRPHILNKVDLFCSKEFVGKVAGIHIRGTDSFFDSGRPNLPLSYFEKLIETKLKDYTKILIATDTVNIVEKLKEKFGSKIISYDSIKLGIDGQHQSLHEGAVRDLNIDTGEEVLIESILLSRCDLLLRQQSNITTFSIVLNPDIKIHQFDLPFWNSWNFHLFSDENRMYREKITKANYYISDLEINDTEYYKSEYINLHTFLTKGRSINSRSYIYTKENLETINNYFFTK